MNYPLESSGSNGSAEFSVTTREFTLREYDTLQEQVRATRDDSRSIERNVIVAIGIFWAFLFKEGASLVTLAHHAFAWWIPVLFSVLGAVRSAALGFKLESLSIYIRKVESHFLSHSQEWPEGWEHFEKKRGGLVRISAWVFWAILTFVTVLVAILAK